MRCKKRCVISPFTLWRWQRGRGGGGGSSAAIDPVTLAGFDDFPQPPDVELCVGVYAVRSTQQPGGGTVEVVLWLQITESGGPGEELPCSTVALAPIEPLAESSLDRVRCGAPPGLGRISAAAPPKKCRQAGKSGFPSICLFFQPTVRPPDRHSHSASGVGLVVAPGPAHAARLHMSTCS